MTTRHSRARFAADCYFRGVDFESLTRFNESEFIGQTVFSGITFSKALFGSAHFVGETHFSGIKVTREIFFEGTRFDNMDGFGPIVVADGLCFSDVIFGRPVTFEAAAAGITLRRVKFNDSATLFFRHALVGLDGTTSVGPLTLVAAENLIGNNRVGGTAGLDETIILDSKSCVPQLLSVRGIDFSKLVLKGIDLSICNFAEAHHIDAVRLEGNCRFTRNPRFVRTSHRRILVGKYTSRNILLEEHQWRADRKFAPWPKPDVPDYLEINVELDHDLEPSALSPERIAALYRQLRKAQEDAKNEPGAADFYYGEMEMRRFAKSTPFIERFILFAYWWFAGYGLRASRAIAGLLCVLVASTILLIAWGLPNSSTPTQQLAGTVAVANQNSRSSEIKAELTPSLSRLPAPSHRWTSERLERAVRISFGSVVFRDSGQMLTTAGLWTTIVARLLGPILLVMSILAIRARVKR